MDTLERIQHLEDKYRKETNPIVKIEIMKQIKALEVKIIKK